MPEVAQHQTSEHAGPRANKAFTLVEVLLAVTLTSILMTVMYGAFHTMGRVIRRNERTKGAYQAARLIMSQMREDLTCAYFSPTRKNFIFRGENVQGYDADADALTFVTAGHVISARDVPEGDFAEVSYYLDEDYPGILVRREDVSPDSEPDVGGVLDIVGKNVVGLNFTYLDGMEQSSRMRDRTTTTTQQQEAEKEQKSWMDDWDSDEKAYLPRAVRIDLSVLNDEGVVEEFSTEVALAMGRTPTSGQPGLTQPTGPTRVPTQPGGPGRQPSPQPGGPRVGPGQRPPGTPEGFQREPRQRGERRGREGTSGPPTPGSGQRPSGRTTTGRGTSYGGSAVRPPTPGGR
jgi:prepilin-type N-terminal cleavage/methylation domain-containing protein